MRILNYIIPTNLQDGNFVKSLHKQARFTGKLSKKQHDALKGILDIDIDFFGYDYEVPKSTAYYDDWFDLLEKLNKNRFRKANTRNRCKEALNSIMFNRPNKHLIEEVLRPGDWQPQFRRR
jgi:hypothetical protein